MVISGHTDIGTVTRALRLAADDYLRRPFHLKEFGLRLEALLRRHGPGILAIAYSRSKAIHLNELSIDVGSGAISKAAPPVSLTERERLALTTLIESAPQPIPRNELSRRLKLDEEHSAQTLSSLMRHLRTKIARSGRQGEPYPGRARIRIPPDSIPTLATTAGVTSAGTNPRTPLLPL